MEQTAAADHFTVIVWAFVGLATALCGLAGVLLPLLIGTRKDAREAREQVKNHHGTNLRDEADQRHHATSGKLDAIYALTAAQAQSIATLTRQVGNLFSRVNDIEDTQERESHGRVTSSARTGREGFAPKHGRANSPTPGPPAWMLKPPTETDSPGHRGPPERSSGN